MRYLLLIYGNEAGAAGMTEEESQASFAEWGEYDQRIRSAGAATAGEALQPTSTATTVTDDGGSPLVTDGPFAETREQLGGFYVLDVADLDEAIRWAHECPGAKGGKIELRPIMEFETS